MLTIKALLEKEIKKTLIKNDPTLKEVVINLDYPRNNFGDYATAIAMVIAKIKKQSPEVVAEELVAVFSASPEIAEFASVSFCKPGFINFTLKPEFLNARAVEAWKVEKYGLVENEQPQKIQVEFLSANPTGPIHIGNGRGGFFGDVLSKVLELNGHEVVREYFVNDAGGQIVTLGHSVLKDAEAVYKGDYIDDLNLRLAKSDLQDKDDARAVGEWSAKIMVEDSLKKTAESAGIKFDVWFSEKENLHDSGKITEVIEKLKQNDFLYFAEGAWWFKSSQFGDERDRVLIKTDGTYTYLAADLAYAQNKFGERKFEKVIYVWGADHHGDVKGLLGGIEALGFKDRAEVILVQFVRLFKDGQEFKISKRRGTYVTVDELLEMVGRDVMRFWITMYSNTSHIDFDLDKASERSEKNPVFYVQYAHARLCSLLSKPEVQALGEIAEYKFNEASEDSERSLLMLLLKYPEVIALTGVDYQVHRLPQYAIELADQLHSFYASVRVIDNGVADKRLVALMLLTKKILGEVLGVIGISKPEKM
jgi:arginyl-tRNA synthetase